MNTHRAVRQFLAKEEKKTELASEKVELGIAQDIQKTIANAKNKIKDVAAAQKRYNAALKEEEEAKSKALDVREEGVDVYQRGGAIREDAMDAAKDLGLDPKGIKGFAELDKILDVLFNDYQTLLRSIK